MIPRRFTRCVPEVTTPQVEAWWEQFAELNPSADMVTVRDPIPPDSWPLLGHLHARATSGAQLAGFVRLEAVWRWGGWYVDSDVEPVRPFGPLDDGSGRLVIGTEDGTHLTDAVFGAPPKHPALEAVIAHVASLYVSTSPDTRELPGAQATGPLATTHVLRHRTDVRIVPRDTFYPYSYLDRDGANDDHRSNPAVHAIHHWHFSWQGT